ncbi:MAG TPA: tRNA lysidine(34) synthetase TilS [Actinobacteria bacterium]|nr:tRNA lysidine(34) synthetase TilS [Actinomycetota bacterium]
MALIVLALYPGPMTTIIDIARASVDRHEMLDDGCVVLAMVSGGADSVALLRLLVAGELGPVSALSVLHVNHGLRGAESDTDEAWVRALCARLGVECTVVRHDVGGYAEADGLNLEDAGRRIRYRFAESELDARCDAMGVPRTDGRIAVAHTADDRIETFLARLVSGAGMGGLSSIAPVRGRVVRPLIDARRTDVTGYLASLGQEWREDATNADTSRERSWVRHELLPVMEERNPGFARSALRTMTVLADEDALLAEMADAFARDFTRVEHGVLVIDRAPVQTLSRPMARRTVRAAVLAAFPGASRLEFEHSEALVDGIGDPGFARDLPFGLRAEVEYDTLRISRKDSDVPVLVPGLLHCPDRLDMGPAGRLECTQGEAGAHVTGPDQVSIDADAVVWPLVVDVPREGDRMRLLGMRGTKKVSDIMVDAKVPRRLRQATPVVRSAGEIVWLAGVRLADQCRVTPETRRVADIVWRRPSSGSDGPTA